MVEDDLSDGEGWPKGGLKSRHKGKGSNVPYGHIHVLVYINRVDHIPFFSSFFLFFPSLLRKW